MSTLEQLKIDWGLERFTPAFGAMLKFKLTHPHPYPIKALGKLYRENHDAFVLLDTQISDFK